jgi:hypothetical protein
MMVALVSAARRRARALLVPLVLFAVPTFAPRSAHATDGTLTRELDALGDWMAAHKHEACTTHCYVLSRLRVTGSVEAGLAFTLEGSVLAEGPVAIPLFGAPEHVRIEEAKVDGKPAAIGFEGDHYFLHTAQKSFTLEGKLRLDATRTLVVAGAVNSFEADLAKGSVQEGARLSGLVGTTLHFDGASATEPGKTEEPAPAPVFQLSRAIRVGREVTFQYALSLRSTSELGVVKVPLAYGERVLEVAGASSWKVEGNDLVLALAGRAATLSIQGSLGEAPIGKPWSFAPDARSTFEWWLVESDPEHKLVVDGTARPMDVTESPMAVTQPNARAFVVTRGQTLTVDVRQLAQAESLAAVVREHRRQLVLTARGDLVADDELSYENNGVDDLRFAPSGRPIFLALDGVATKVLAAPDGPGVLIPLYKGVHAARVQSVGAAGVGRFGGVLALPTPSQPLTASRVELAVGVPREVHPIALLGGDRPVWFLEAKDAIAAAVAVAVSCLALAGWRRRVLGAIALGGLWLASEEAFVGALVVAALGVLGVRLARSLSGKKPSLRPLALAGALLALTAIFVGVVGTKSDRQAPTSVSDSRRGEDGKMGNAALAEKDKSKLDEAERLRAPAASASAAPNANALEQNLPAGAKGEAGDVLAGAGVKHGVAPVALPMPRADRWVSTSRELVTADRPFEAKLIYVTDAIVWPLFGAWLASIAALAWALRDRIRAALSSMRERWNAPEPPEPKEEPKPEEPTPAATT